MTKGSAGSVVTRSPTAQLGASHINIMEGEDMEVQELMTIISNYGFPIACVVVMFAMWNKERMDHKEEVAKMTEAVNNNTTALEKLMTTVNMLGGAHG